MKTLRILIFILFSGLSIWAQPEIPILKNYVNDFTGTLTPEQKSYLEQALKEFDDSTSTQIVVLMINSLDGYPIEMYANETAEKNKIGTKEHDNGILFLIAKDDRKMRIEVGYGLEGALPDALASSILRNEVAPYFRKNQYYKGIVAGLSSIIRAVKGEYTGKPKGKKNNGLSIFIFYMILFFIFFILASRRGRGGGGGIIYYGGGFGGGGFSGGGGSFGGFSGGGGSFGGGGASGSW